MSAFDLHIHSKYSFDSSLEPEKIVEVAKRKGLAGIAIVDHNTIQGSIKAKEIARGELFVICGTEINTEIGDILGLFINQDIHSRKFADVIDEIKNQGGISILAHPYKRKRWAQLEIIQKIDAIEVFNSRNSANNNNARLLAQQHNLPFVGGSDAHFAFEIGRGRTLFNNLSNINIETMKQEILKGKTRALGENTSPFLDILSQGIKIFKSYSR
jgi:hypothetical protein